MPELRELIQRDILKQQIMADLAITMPQMDYSGMDVAGLTPMAAHAPERLRTTPPVPQQQVPKGIQEGRTIGSLGEMIPSIPPTPGVSPMQRMGANLGLGLGRMTLDFPQFIGQTLAEPKTLKALPEQIVEPAAKLGAALKVSGESPQASELARETIEESIKHPEAVLMPLLAATGAAKPLGRVARGLGKLRTPTDISGFADVTVEGKPTIKAPIVEPEPTKALITTDIGTRVEKMPESVLEPIEKTAAEIPTAESGFIQLPAGETKQVTPNVTISRLPNKDVGILSGLQSPSKMFAREPNAAKIQKAGEVAIDQVQRGIEENFATVDKFSKGRGGKFNDQQNKLIYELGEGRRNMTAEDAGILGNEGIEAIKTLRENYDNYRRRIFEHLKERGEWRKQENAYIKQKLAERRQELGVKRLPRGEAARVKTSALADPQAPFPTNYKQWGMDDYMAHIFRGQWKIQAKTKTGETIQYWRPNEKTSIEVANEILKQNPDATISIEQTTFVPQEAVTQLSRKGYFGLVNDLEKASQIPLETVREAVGKRVRIKPRKRYAGFMQKREFNLETYEPDPIKAYKFYAVAAERWLALDKFRRTATDAFENIPGGQFPRMKAEVASYMDRVQGRPAASEIAINNTLEKFGETKLGQKLFGGKPKPFAASRYAAKVTGLMSKFKLGLRPSSTATNLSQTVTHTYPKIGNYIFEGMKLFPTSKGKYILDKLDIKFQKAKHHAGELSIKDTQKWYNSMYMFQKAEQLNRSVAACGAYQYAVKKLGMSETQALEYARNLVRDTQFRYDVADAPRYITGPVGRTLGQFKTFTIKDFEFAWDVWRKGTAAEKTRFIGGRAAAGGARLASFPIRKPIKTFILGSSVGYTLYSYLKDKIGLPDEVAMVVTYGVPGLLEIDMGNQIEPFMPELSFDEQTGKWLLGPTGSALYEAGKLGGKALAGTMTKADERRALRELAPRGAMSAYEGIKPLVTGGEYRSGITGKKRIGLTPYESAMKIGGFQPVRESQMWELKSDIAESKELERAAQQRIFDYIVDGDVDKAIDEIERTGIDPTTIDFEKRMQYLETDELQRAMMGLSKLRRMGYLEKATELSLIGG